MTIIAKSTINKKLCSPPPLDFQHQALCLKGLDGLTLQALWLRLGSSPGYTWALSVHAKLFALEIIEHLDQVSFYRLGQASPDPWQVPALQGDLGIVIEPDDLP